MLKLFDTVLAFSVVMLLLSLIVTAIVQAVSAVLDLRGKNLIKAVTLLLKQADPDLEADARKVAEKVCRHPAVATGWRPFGKASAKALRVQELVNVLNSPAVVTLLKQGALQKTVAGVGVWFETVMDRSSDWFATVARAVTVVAAFLLAFGLHVDSLALLKQLSTDAAVRNKLASQAGAALQTAEGLSTSLPVAKTIAALASDTATDPQAATFLKGLTPPNTCREAVASLGKEPQVSAAVVESFQKRCWDETVPYLRDTHARFDTIVKELQLDGLRLFEPAGGRPGCTYWLCAALARCGDKAPIDWRTLLGTLMTALFLSFGAPFWFNTLRQLVNLRPLVAGKVEQAAAVKS